MMSFLQTCTCEEAVLTKNGVRLRAQRSALDGQVR